MNISEIISNRRKQLKLTLEEVGNIVGVSKSTVKKWENGFISNMRRDKISLLAKALQLDPVTLITGQDTNDTNQNASPIGNQFILSEHEKQLITAYRSRPDMQAAIDTLLGINKDAAELIADDIIKTTKGQQNTAPINQRTK